ncbi:MAG TPA: hypothetical protein VFQ35_05445 [Polyangiaceae bacterium]|nr:hypothetical protein [Polyangiaceae bacterium]
MSSAALTATAPHSWLERCGLAAGKVLAPITFATSRVRNARMFHPDGVMYQARVQTCGESPDLYALGMRLAGDAIVRLSSAWWRGKEWPDVLGLAVRFQSPGSQPLTPGPRDQDLLLATVRFPWTTPLAPLATRFGSFLWNHYHAVSPFEAPEIGRVKLRLRSPRIENTGPLSRAEHLERAVVEGRAEWVLEARRLNRMALVRHWEPVAMLTLTRAIDVDQTALRFSPFRTGRDLLPVGFVHYLRVAAYAASQRGRPA